MMLLYQRGRERIRRQREMGWRVEVNEKSNNADRGFFFFWEKCFSPCLLIVTIFNALERGHTGGLTWLVRLCDCVSDGLSVRSSCRRAGSGR